VWLKRARVFLTAFPLKTRRRLGVLFGKGKKRGRGVLNLVFKVIDKGLPNILSHLLAGTEP